MEHQYITFRFQLVAILFLLAVFSACKKDNTAAKVVNATPITLGLYQYSSGNNKRVFIPITKLGTQTINYYGVFDTGSSGLTLDATGILPASMITSSGITVTGDSVVVNGITVTNKTSILSFGDLINSTVEYGNLAYAAVTIGDANGNQTIKRVPFFLYYKIVDENGVKLEAHAADVFGVGPGVSYANNLIASPLSYLTPGTGLTNGFKLALLNLSSFSSAGAYVSKLLSIGLTSADLSANGFIMHPLNYSSAGGYSPNIPATITYNGTSTSAQVLFDTGTPSVTVIEDKKATGIGSLPASSVVKLTTTQGFTYQYTTTSITNLTAIQNPNNTGDYRSIFAIDFFTNNEYLTDYTNHKIGLKNN